MRSDVWKTQNENRKSIWMPMLTRTFFFSTQILYENAPGNTIEKFRNPDGINVYVTQYTQNGHTVDLVFGKILKNRNRVSVPVWATAKFLRKPISVRMHVRTDEPLDGWDKSMHAE